MPTAVEELTVDELAARTGMTVRTVRFYAAEGLLPAPERRGRVAYYGVQHHGYTLAAIERVLDRIPLDASAAEFAMQAALLAPWTPERTEELDRDGLERRAGRRLGRQELDLLLALGIVERTGQGRFRTTPSTLGMGLSMLDLPVPAAVLRDAGAVAEGLAEVFRHGVWEPFRRGETGDREQLAALVRRLRPLVVQGLVSAFGHAADRAVRRA